MASAKSNVIIDFVDSLESTCRECESPLIEDKDRGEYICGTCGLVQEMKVFDPSDRPAFTEEEWKKRARAGNKLNPLGTDIGSRCNGPSSTSGPFNPRARKWQNRAPYAIQLYIQADNDLKRIVSQLKIPDRAQKFAAVVFKNLQKDKLLRGRSVNVYEISCLYYSCRMQKIPFNIEEVVEWKRGITEKGVNKGYRLINRMYSEKYGRIPVTNASSLVPKYVSNLIASGLSDLTKYEQETIQHAIEERCYSIIAEYSKRRLDLGKDPRGVVAGVLYTASNQWGKPNGYEFSQRTIANISGITEVTLRSRLKEIKPLCPETVTTTKKHYKREKG